MSSEPVISISGKVHYLSRIGLSPNTTLYVSLLDVTLADAPAKELAQQVIENAETTGLDFTLTCRPADTVPGHDYAISARITHNDRLIFATAKHHPVFLDVAYLQPQEVLVSPIG